MPVWPRPRMQAALVWGEIFAHILQPILFVVELWVPALQELFVLDIGDGSVRDDVTNTDRYFGRTDYGRSWTPGLFDLSSLFYMMLAIPSFVGLTPSLSERLLGEPFLGSTSKLRAPWRSFVSYMFFWTITFMIKVWFDYTFIIEPLVEPTHKLWQVDMYCWHYNTLYANCKMDMVDLVTQSNNELEGQEAPPELGQTPSAVHVVRFVRMRVFAFLLISLRWMTRRLIIGGHHLHLHCGVCHWELAWLMATAR